MDKFNKNGSINLIDRINQNPEMQLKIIQHFFPQACLKKKFKTHEEKDPSTSLKLHNGKYWLKNFASTDKAMDCFNISQEKLDLEMPEVLKYLTCNLFPEYQFNSSKSASGRSPFEKQLFAIKNNPKQQAKEYLEGRGIKCDKLPSGAFFQNVSQDKKADGIVFLDSNEKLINKRFFDEKEGKSRYLDAGEARGALYTKCFQEDKDTVFITEGVIDTLSLFPACSSISIFSATNSVSQTKLESFIKNKKVVIALDNDNEDDKAAEVLCQNILDWNVPVISIQRIVFPLKKDANNLLRKGILFKYLKDRKNYKQVYPEHIPDSINEDTDQANKKYYIKNSSYHVKKKVGDTYVEKDMSNFIMKTLYFIPGNLEKSKRIIALQNRNGDNDVISVSPKELKYNNIEEHLLSRGSYAFWGSNEIYKRILVDLDRDKKTAIEPDYIGYQERTNCFVLGAGVLKNNQYIPSNRHGVVNLGNINIYLPAFSEFNKNSKDYENTRSFNYKKGKLSFERWASLFYKAFGEKAMVGIFFAIGSLFRDILMKELSAFPHLFLFGDYGTGKTTFTKMIISLFGPEQDGISLDGVSTIKGIARSMNQINNGIIYLKEMSPEYEKKLKGIILCAYDNGVSAKGILSTDNRTQNDEYLSSLIFDGNYLPTSSSALVSRMNLLVFRKKKLKKVEVEAFRELDANIKFGFGAVLSEILNQRSYFEEFFRDCFDDVYQELKSEHQEANDVDERNIKNTAFYLSIFKCLKNKLNFPFEYDVFYELIRRLESDQDDLLKRVGDINKFWSVLDTLKILGKLRSNLFKVYDKDERKVFAIQFGGIYSEYVSYCISQKEDHADKNSLRTLLINQDYFIPTTQKKIGVATTVKGMNSVYLFDFNQLPLEKELWLK